MQQKIDEAIARRHAAEKAAQQARADALATQLELERRATKVAAKPEEALVGGQGLDSACHFPPLLLLRVSRMRRCVGWKGGSERRWKRGCSPSETSRLSWMLQRFNFSSTPAF